MAEKIVRLEEQIKNIPKNERRQFLIDKLNFYRSGPDGCVAYINENLCLPNGTGVWVPINLWDIQKRLIWELADFLFDMDREVFVLLGSRQCGKTATMNIMCDYLMTMFSNYAITLLHADATRGANCLNECRTIIDNKSPITKYPKLNDRGMMMSFKNLSRYQVIPTQKSSKKGKTDTGRSLTSKLLWLDEAAFIDISRLEASLWPMTSQAFIACREYKIPFGIIMSSSANGRIGIGKRYYEFWKMAEANSEDGIVSRGEISGFKLHYSQIPGKDEKWVREQKLKTTERDFNQEFECFFYGGESTFFTDDTIKEIQDRMTFVNDNIKPEILNFFSTTGEKFEIKLFKPIEANTSYIMGIDVSKGANLDAHVLEVFDYNTMEQVLEVTNNRASHTDFVELVKHVTKNIILFNNGRVAIAIENNLGYSLITDLQKEDPLFYNLLYRDTIGCDYKAKKDGSIIPYNDCKYGIATTTLTRPMIIELIYRFVTGNIDKLNSHYLLSEIEGIEVKENKIEGATHDDSVFALGMLLLMKEKGRIQSINAILDNCEEYWINSKGTDKNGNPISSRKIMCEVSEEDGKENPYVGISMQEGIMHMKQTRIPTGMKLPFAVVSGSRPSTTFQISQIYRETENVQQMYIELQDKNVKKAKMLDCPSLKKTYEDAPKPNDLRYSQHNYENDWGGYVAE